MSKISAVILTKNSENILADCIESLAFCDEVIIIDDNSTDRTIDLAKRLGARVEKIDKSSTDFSAKRNFGLKKARSKWIIYVDADERISEQLKNSILENINNRNTDFSAFKIYRKNYYLGRHEWPYIETLERLFDKSYLKGWQGKLHESPIIEGKIGQLEGFLLHYTHRDLQSMVAKTIEWSALEAQSRIESNHPPMAWWRFFRVMITAFYNSYFKQRGYKAGTAGLIESIYQSYSIFITYARLWELQNQKNGKKQ